MALRYQLIDGEGNPVPPAGYKPTKAQRTAREQAHKVAQLEQAARTAKAGQS